MNENCKILNSYDSTFFCLNQKIMFILFISLYRIKYLHYNNSTNTSDKICRCYQCHFAITVKML